MVFKHELRTDIKKLIEMLQRHFDYFDTPKNKVNKPLTVCDEVSKTFTQKILNQVKGHVRNHLERLEYIRGLTSEDSWKNYKLFGIQNLREQKMYKDAHRRLMNEWKFERPRKKKKKKTSGTKGQKD